MRIASGKAHPLLYNPTPLLRPLSRRAADLDVRSDGPAEPAARPGATLPRRRPRAAEQLLGYPSMAEENRYEEALKTLNAVYWALMEQLVDKILAQRDYLAGDLPFELGGGFALQEIEDQFSMRLAQLRQLMMELSNHVNSGGRPNYRVDTVWGARTDLEKKINRRLAKLRPAFLVDVKISKVSEEEGFVATIVHADRPPRAVAPIGE